MTCPARRVHPLSSNYYCRCALVVGHEGDHETVDGHSWSDEHRWACRDSKGENIDWLARIGAKSADANVARCADGEAGRDQREAEHDHVREGDADQCEHEDDDCCDEEERGEVHVLNVPRYQLGLRPTCAAGCATMKKNTRYPKLVVFVLVVVGILGFLLMALPDDGNAHTPKPVACEVAWQQAPPGAKWAAKQRCVAAQVRHSCVAHARPVPGSVRVKGQRLAPGHSRYWRNQRHVIGWIVNEGLRRDLSRTVVLAAIVATTQESSARERPDGHGTSVGPFQLISDHGPAHLRITVEFSGNWFYNGALKEWRRLGPMSPPALAQEVEESAHPSEYAQWLPEAKHTLAAVLGPCRLRTT